MVSGTISLFSIEVLFTFPSRYWFAIGLTEVFSLTGWSRQIRAEFHVFRVTQDTAMPLSDFEYGIITLYDTTFQWILLTIKVQQRGPTTPLSRYHDNGLGSSPFARHY